MNAKTLFATPARSRGYTAADMATASADGWRAGQAADNELLDECRMLISFMRTKLSVSYDLMDEDVQATLAKLNERLA